MATDDDATTRALVETVVTALAKRDTVAAASAYAPDGVFVDPQYPADEYRGPDAIRDAFDWALTNLAAQPAFAVSRVVEEGCTCVVEVETNLVAVDPPAETCELVFVVDGGAGGITSWQVYLPFPPD